MDVPTMIFHSLVEINILLINERKKGKIMKKILLVILISILPAHAFAFSGYLTPLAEGVSINKYLLHRSGEMTIWVTNTSISNPDNCTNTDRVHIRASLAGSQNMIAAVMTAYASGQKVGFHSSGCSVIPFWGGTQTVPIISEIWVIK
ncbi:MAG: hypothetical protein COA47_14870 [Robiginitomaculum sp.]|nr:MAG: hypothetical protein COA47_14870 [Robiginitomaculum sp.]